MSLLSLQKLLYNQTFCLLRLHLWGLSRLLKSLFDFATAHEVYLMCFKAVKKSKTMNSIGGNTLPGMWLQLQ